MRRKRDQDGIYNGVCGEFGYEVDGREHVYRVDNYEITPIFEPVGVMFSFFCEQNHRSSNFKHSKKNAYKDREKKTERMYE